jgi:hypothetical protein
VSKINSFTMIQYLNFSYLKEVWIN